MADPAASHPYNPRIISATPEEFERQIQWVSKNYEVVDSRDVLSAIEGQSTLPSRAVVLTFDDGYPDFASTVWPILDARSLPATLFVPTAYPLAPDVPFWWDRLYACIELTELERFVDERLGTLALGSEHERSVAAQQMQGFFKSQPHASAMAWLDQVCEKLCPDDPKLRSTLSWAEIRALADKGVTIGAHSQTHPLLTRVSREQARDEIEGSLGDLKKQLGSVLPIFCYPAGANNKDVQRIAGECGVVLGYGTETGHNILERCNLLDLRRINVTQRTTLDILRIKLSAIGIIADRIRKAIRH